jgi:hypothetical protein
MQQFNNGRKFDRTSRTGFLPRRVTMTQQQQRGPQPLPSPTQQIAGDFGNRLIRRGTLTRQFLFDLEEVFPDQLKYFLGG